MAMDGVDDCVANMNMTKNRGFRICDFFPNGTGVSDDDTKQGNTNVPMVDLFGGAITTSIPSSWRDVSQVRQVPDKQEVYQDCNEERGVSCFFS